MRKLIRFFNQMDTPSFARYLRVPLWLSLLIDFGRLLTFGLWEPPEYNPLQRGGGWMGDLYVSRRVMDWSDTRRCYVGFRVLLRGKKCK